VHVRPSGPRAKIDLRQRRVEIENSSGKLSSTASHASLHLICKATQGKIFEKRAFSFSTISLRLGNRPKAIASLVDLNLPRHFLSLRGTYILNFSRDYPEIFSLNESRAEIRGRYTVARKSNRIRVTWDLQDAKRADSPRSLSLVSLLRWREAPSQGRWHSRASKISDSRLARMVIY